MNAAEFLDRLGADAKPTATANGWQCRCPAHDDGKASLCVTQAGDRTLIHCQAGCTPQAVCTAAGVKLADLFNGEKPQRNGAAKRIVATYDYRDENGALLLQAVRYEPKDFRQRTPDPTAKDGWRWTTAGVRRVLYRLPELIQAVQGGCPIVICEGEKDADALAKLGFAATCNLGGAGKWRADYNAALRGARVYVVADKDEPGRDHAHAVAAALQGVAAFVAVLEFPDRNGNAVKDAADFIAAGAGVAEIQTELDAAPAWRPTPVAGRPTNPTKRDNLASKPLAPNRSAAPTLATATTAADVRGFILTILLSKATAFQQRQEIADAVVTALRTIGGLFHHAELRDFETAMFFHRERRRLEKLRSDSFLSWLSDWLAVNRAEPLFSSIKAAVETAALSSPHSSAIVPESFWCARPGTGTVYLSNGDGQLVKISKRGLELADNGTDGVLFAAGKTLAPWKADAVPADVFETCSLFRDARTAAEHGKDLLRAWMYSLPTNPRTKPPLCLSGEIGSGKTRLAKGIAELYGLPFRAAKVEENNEADFWPNVDAGGLYVLDNADTRCKWLADTLANAATDGCAVRRRLYTNAETVTLKANAWLAVTTANATFAADAGLADRLLLVRTHRAEGHSSDSALSDQIAANRDAALVHIGEAIAAALRDTSPTPGGLNARHPDFAAFAVRLGRAVGREAATVAALQSAEADKSRFCLENDTLGAALLAHVTSQTPLEGDAAALRTALAATDPSVAEWSNKSIGRRLSALWPHIAAALDAKRTQRQGTWTFRIAYRGFVALEP